MKRYPGKFEGCADQRLGERLYNLVGEGWCDEEFGEVAYGSGWHGFIYRPNRRLSYVVHEDNQGFFDYENVPSKQAQDLWNTFRAEYDTVEDEE